MLVSLNAIPAQPFTVPQDKGYTLPPNFGCQPSGYVDYNWFVQTVLVPLSKNPPQIEPNTLPIFLTYSVFLYDGAAIYLGFHDDFSVQNKGIVTVTEATFGGFYPYPGART